MSDTIDSQPGPDGQDPDGAGRPQGSGRLGNADARALATRTRMTWRQLLLIGTFVVMLVAFAAASPDQFATWQNVRNGLNDLTVLALLAMAVTVVLYFGQFDLAAPAVASLAVVVVGVLTTTAGMGSGVLLIVAVLVTVLIGTSLGTASGLGVAYGSASSFVVTLAVSSVAYGLELLVQSQIGSGATSISRPSLPSPLLGLTDTRIAGLELTVFLTALIAVGLWFLMTRSVYGRNAQAIGGNEDAARLAGVPVERIKWMGFALGGTLAALAGLALAARSGYFSNSTTAFLLPAYAAAFFGAAAVGRRGFSIPATLFGVFYLQTLSNGLQALNQPVWMISVVQGLVLFATVMLARGRTL